MALLIKITPIEIERIRKRMNDSVDNVNTKIRKQTKINKTKTETNRNKFQTD